VGAHALDAVSHRINLDVVNFGDRYGYEPGVAPGRHPMLEAIVDDIGIPEDLGLEVRVASAIPPGCSTGTSAAVAVALIGALDAFQPRPRSLDDVARAAHRIEVERLGLQSGVQDQFCAAFGDINFIEIDTYPDATRSSVTTRIAVRRELEERLLLVYLGEAHRSSEVHQRVIARLVGAGEDSAELEELRACAMMARDAVLAGDLEALGRAMIRNTDAQRRMHGELVSVQAQALIDLASSQGASGWKVNGAGGEGGSLTILCGPGPGRNRALARKLLVSDPAIEIIPIRLSQDGLWVSRS
jgi:D-glycero-alpha-D-manno-heptose-7-phosphate kinase